jgi:hypothetical protein
MIYTVERLDAWGDWNEIYRGIDKEAAGQFLRKISHGKADGKTRIVELK